MLNHFTSCMKLQKGGAKQSGVSMVGVFLMVAASLLMKALLVQLSWNLVMPQVLNEKSGLNKKITFIQALMLVILVSNLL